MKSKFNRDLYLKIRAEKKVQNQSLCKLSEELLEHELIGRKLQNVFSQSIFTIDRVFKRWENGFYIVLLCIGPKGLEHFVVWKSIDCNDENIWLEIEKTHERLRLL